jgi:hypothetical protein
MSFIRSCVACLSLLLASACVQSQAPVAPPADQAGAGGPAPEQGAQDQPPPEAEKASSLVQGEWALELTPTQQRQHELLQLAFQDPPPTQDELAALDLAPDEELMLGMVLMGREQHPDDAATPQVHRSLAELSSATLTVSADTMVFSHGEEADEASYTVVNEEGGSLVVETTTQVEGQPVVEKVNILLEGRDRLQLWAEGEPASARQAFVRRGAQAGDGAPPAPGAQPQGEAKPPQGEAKPPQGEAKPPQGEAKPPQGQQPRPAGG